MKRRRIAIPDIFLFKNNELVEIKSTWTYDEQNMRDKIKVYKKLGYNVRLIIGTGRKTLLEKYTEKIFKCRGGVIGSILPCQGNSGSSNLLRDSIL